MPSPSPTSRTLRWGCSASCTASLFCSSVKNLRFFRVMLGLSSSSYVSRSPSNRGSFNQHSLKIVELNQEIEGGGIVPLDVNRDVDVLFVIDDSFTMGEEQGLLAKNFANFVHVLERPEVNANYRIVIVSSDLGHAKCDDDVGLGGRAPIEKLHGAIG